jgi:hypothetical protein
MGCFLEEQSTESTLAMGYKIIEELPHGKGIQA